MSSIAFIIHGLCMGGAEKFTISLLNHMHQNGRNVFLIILSDDLTLRNELHPDIPILKVLRKSKYDFSITKKITSILSQYEVNKVFCINTFSYFFIKVALINNNTIQVFLSLHSTSSSNLKNYLQNFLYFRFINRHDRIVFLCENQKRQMTRNYLIPKSIHYVINNGIDTQYYLPSSNTKFIKNEARGIFKLKDDESIILKVARIAPEKGHLDAIEALYILHDKYNEPAHLFLVGDGSIQYKNKIKKSINHKGLQSFVHFEGNRQDVRWYYQIADIFTLTSTNTETFSIAALEAMAYGLPCSITEIGGANEMIKPGVNGILTTPRDPLSIADSWYTLLSSKPKKDMIREHVLNHFNKESMLSKYDSILI